MQEGQQEEVLITDFTGGITNDPRSRDPGVSQIVTNFDIFTDMRRALPYPDSEDGDGNSVDDLMQQWCIALRTGTTYSLYGLGRQTASNKVRIFYKNPTTGGSTDLDDNGWTETTNNTAAAQVSPNYDLFVFYKKTGLIYGGHGNRYIYAYDPSGTAGFDETHLDLTSFTTMAQGLVHSQDDILYVPYDNKIASNDNGSWVPEAFVVPEEFYITSICEYQEFLSVACAPLNGIGRSRVYLWNRSSSLNTVSANIDWGRGVIKVIEELQGSLIGVSLAGGNQTRNKHRVTFKRYLGASGAVKFKEFTTTSSPTVLTRKQKDDDRIYFLMSILLNGAQRDGVWSIGVGNHGYAVAHERTPANDTSIGSGPLRGFFNIGDYMFIAYVDASSNHKVSKTNDQASYTATSIQETVKMNFGDASLKKSLDGAFLTFEPMPAAGIINVYYRKDSETSWTLMFTETTDNELSHSAIGVDAGPKISDFKEIQFRVESTGGVVPTSFYAKATFTGKRQF